MKNLKSILILFSIFIVLIGGVVYYASTRFSEEDIKHMVKSGLEKTFPEANIAIGDVKYTLGPSISFVINDVSIRLKEARPGEELFAVKKTYLKIPIWSLLSDGGEVSLNVDSPQVTFFEYKEGNNWSEAKGSTLLQKQKTNNSKKTVKDSQAKDKAGSEIFIPAFFAKSRINIRFDNTDILYQTKTQLKGQLEIRKLLIKNLSIKESLAYELQSKIDLKQEGKEVVQTSILMIGELNTPRLIEQGEIETKLELQLRELKVAAIKQDLPDFKANFNIATDEERKLMGTSNIDFGGFLNGSLGFLLGDIVQIKDIKLLSNLESLIKLSPNKVDGLNINNSQLKLLGKVNVEGDFIYPDLSFSNTNPLIYNLNELNNLKTETTFIGSVSSQIFNLSTITKTLEGEVLSKVSVNLPRDIKKTSLETLGKVRSEINLNNLNISEDFVRKIMEKKKENTEADKTVVKDKPKKELNVKQKALAPFLLPNFSTDIKLRNVKLGESKIGMNALVAGKDSKVGADKIKMNIDNGIIDLTFLAQFQREDLSVKFDTQAKNLPMKSIKIFLPSEIKKVSGQAFLKAEGEYSVQKKKPVFSVGVTGDIKNGEISGLNLKQYLDEYISKIPNSKKYVKEKDLEISDKFDSLSFKSLLKHNHFKFSKFAFIGVSNNLQLTGNADVFPPETKKVSVATMTFDDPKGKLGQSIKRAYGKTSFPIRLEGPGYALKPDYEYTAKKVVKGVAKVQGKKVLKKEGKKVIDKYLKGDTKKKAEKLLKGLFN